VTRKAIIAAAICGVAGLVMLLLYMQRFEDEASGGEQVQVLLATRNIPLGAAITRDMLGGHPIPRRYVEDRHIPLSEAERIIGVRVTSGVRGNESILWTDLATTSDQGRDLSALVRSGMRAITIRGDVSASFGGLLRPGDRVDVLLTAERREQSDHVTIPLLQNVLVLASGRDTGGPARPGEPRGYAGANVNQVTLSVTLEQASVIALAQEQGRLTLVLRNPDDNQIRVNAPDTTTADIIERERRANLQRRQPTPEEPRLPQRVE
jgi:pilus assembly protein CpaB